MRGDEVNGPDRRGRLARFVATVTALAVVGVIVPSAPAVAVDVDRSGRERLLGEVTVERLDIRLPDGSRARGNLLSFPEDDANVDLRARLARDQVSGTERMPTLNQREFGRGAIAGTNASYGMSRPWGGTNGLHVDQGRLLQGQAVNRSGRPTGRGMVGWRADGAMVMDIIDVGLELHRPDVGLGPLEIDEINRQIYTSTETRSAPSGELLLFDDRYGTKIRTRARTKIVTVEGLEVGTSGMTTGRVSAVNEVPAATEFEVPDGRHVLVGYGDRFDDVGDAQVGESIGIGTVLQPEATDGNAWADLAGGVAGGQLLIRDGERRPASGWISDAAFGSRHVVEQRARNAIGRTADGRILMVVVDENSSGNTNWSSGLSVSQLADLMSALGARDAVNLDGGGPAQMWTNGQLRNRPSHPERQVFDGLFVYVPRPGSARSLAEACPPEVLVASFTDVPGTTHAESIGCLAGWGVTRGVTPTTFAPNDDVTRGQLASFLQQWIDDAAERGSGNRLPDETPMPFTDVADGNPHARAIARMAEVGIIAGRTPTTFEPSAPVTRAQTSTLIAGAVEYVTGQELPRERDVFIDDNGNTHEHAIDRLAAAGLVVGTGGWSFRPNSTVSRGAIASFLMRSSALLVDEGVVTVPSEPPTVAGEDEEPDASDEGDDAADGDDGAVEDDADTSDGDDGSGDEDASDDEHDDPSDGDDVTGDGDGATDGATGDDPGDDEADQDDEDRQDGAATSDDASGDDGSG